MSPPRKSARGRSFGLRFLARLIGWSFTAAIALIVLTYLALPALLRYGLPHALARFGVLSSVEGARVSLMNERITLVGFQVSQPGGPAIRWGEVSARVDMAELLKGNIRIIDFQVKDARVDLAQLQKSKWTPPERAAAIPELRKLNVNIGNVVLQDLEFVGLSEQVGRKVALRSLSLGSLSHLEAGARVAFQLEGVVGDGSLRLAGQARMVANLPVFEGRYELRGLDLKGFGHVFGLATPRSVGGEVDGSGTFGLAYVQGEGVVRSEFFGSARVGGLELDSGETSITRTTAEWEGRAEVFWPVAGGLPRFVARGSVVSPTLEAARRTAAAPYGILVRGLTWSGEMRRASEFETAGRLNSELIRIDASREGEPWFKLELARLSADPRYRSDGRRYEFDAGKVTAASANLNHPLNPGRRSITAFRLTLERVRLGTGGFGVGRLVSESAEATERDRTDAQAVRRVQFISLGASGIEIRAGEGVFVDRLETDRAEFNFENVSVDLGHARARGVKAGANSPFEATAVSASSLRQQSGDFETWGTNLQLSGALVLDSGEILSDSAEAEKLSQTIAGNPLWQANGVQAAPLSIDSRRIEAGKLRTRDVAYGDPGGNLVEIEHGEAAGLFIRYGSGIDAKSAQLGLGRYRSGEIAVLELAEAELNGPGVTFQGELSAEAIDADSARYVDSRANVSLLETLKVGELAGHLSTEIRIDAARTGRLVHDGAAGTDYKVAGLELSQIRFSGAGDASAAAGRVDNLEVALSDGSRLSLEDVAAARPARTVAGNFTADSGRVRSIRYSADGERILGFRDIELGAIDGDGYDGHRVSSVSAASAVASDPSAGGLLEIGSVQITAIRISAPEGVHADAAIAREVSLAGVEGEPSAAFTSDRISLKALAFKPGERLRLGEVLVDNATLTMGLDDEGELVRPEPPFLHERDASAGSLVIERLETRQSARLKFFDRSASPPFEVDISPLAARLQNFHSDDASRPAKFTLDGNAGEFSNLEASGEAFIDGDGLNFQISGKITAFELDRLNMYAAKHAERAIRSGRGDAAFDITVSDRKLSGVIRFVFSRVEFDTAQASTTGEDKNKEALTLQRAFALLRDEDGIVRLTVPLSGSLEDPGFDFSDILVRALMRALRSTVMLTFKPLGLSVGPAGLGGASDRLEFAPVAFDPGEQKLSGEALAHLNTLAQELKRHPGLNVRLCGRAVSADRIRIERRSGDAEGTALSLSADESVEATSMEVLLQNLARQRALVVRRYLQEEKEIAGQRLLHCDAQVESTPGRLPRVELRVRVDHESIAPPEMESRE